MRINLTRASALLDEAMADTEMAAHRVGVAREFVADFAHCEAQMKTSKARLRHDTMNSKRVTDWSKSRTWICSEPVPSGNSIDTTARGQAN